MAIEELSSLIPVRCVYLDVCALNRPLDDQNQMRIRLKEVGTEVATDLFQVRSRAEQLHGLGLGVADAAHAAFAEFAGCDFVTVDDRLLRQLRRAGSTVWFGTPTTYCGKEDLR